MLQQGKSQAKKTAARTPAKTPGKTVQTRATNPANGKTSNRKKQSESLLIHSQQRQQMINEAAYYLAQQRGFTGGNPVDDWLTAEVQVDQLLAHTGK